jgi:hypothetical protein
MLHALDGSLPYIGVMQEIQRLAEQVAGGAFFNEQALPSLDHRFLSNDFPLDPPEIFLKSSLLCLGVIADDDLDILFINDIAGLLLHAQDDPPGLFGAQALVEKNFSWMASLAFFFEDGCLLPLPFHMVGHEGVDLFPADTGLVLLFHPLDGIEPDFSGTVLSQGPIWLMAPAAIRPEELSTGLFRGGLLGDGRRVTAEGGAQG